MERLRLLGAGLQEFPHNKHTKICYSFLSRVLLAITFKGMEHALGHSSRSAFGHRASSGTCVWSLFSAGTCVWTQYQERTCVWAFSIKRTCRWPFTPSKDMSFVFYPFLNGSLADKREAAAASLKAKREQHERLWELEPRTRAWTQ